MDWQFLYEKVSRRGGEGTKKCAPSGAHPSFLRSAGLLLDLFEIALVDAANRACPVVVNLLGRRSGRGGNPADVLYR